MTIDRGREKAHAREVMRQAQVSPYLFTALFVVIHTVLNGITLVMGSAGMEKAPYFVWGDFSYTVPTLISLPPAVVMFLSLLVGLLLTVLMYGYYSYSMTVRAGNYAPFDTLFDGFTYVGKVIVLELLMALFITMWYLLILVPVVLAILAPYTGLVLVVPLTIAAMVPGIIAIYRYRFAHFNLCENPDLRPMEALRMSTAQTKGLKWQLFVMDLSFLGWVILVSLTMGLANIYVMPYRLQTELGYYEYGKQASGVKPVPDDFGSDGQFHSYEL